MTACPSTDTYIPALVGEGLHGIRSEGQPLEVKRLFSLNLFV